MYFGGVLGFDPFFYQYYTVIDYLQKKLTINDPLAIGQTFDIVNKEGLIADYTFTYNNMFIKNVFLESTTTGDTVSGYFHLDTGTPSTLTTGVNVTNVRNFPNETCTNIYLGGFVNEKLASCSELILSGSDFPTQVYNGVGVSVMGKFGSSFFKDYELHIDHTNKKVGFLKPQIVANTPTENDINDIFLIYPNPTMGSVEVRLSKSKLDLTKATLKLIDIMGRSVPFVIKNKNRSMLRLDMNHLPAGTYLLKIENGSNPVMKKIIKH